MTVGLKVVEGKSLKWFPMLFIVRGEEVPVRGAFTAPVFKPEETGSMTVAPVKIEPNFVAEETFPYEEINYIIEGELIYTSEGKTVTARKGDYVVLPQGSTVNMEAKDIGCELVAITYPKITQAVVDGATIRSIKGGP